MSIYESLLTPEFVLNEQIARQIFDIFPENGPIVAILDKDGNTWPSDSEEFSKLKLDETFLKELCSRIDDGVEPVITSIHDMSIIGTQLATEQNKCGYVIIALPQYSPDSTLINADLLEILINQFSLIAKLIEKNNQLYEVQMKQYGLCGQDEVVLN